MTDADLDRLRSITLGLPGVTERLSHGAPCFFVRHKRPICYYHDKDFSSDDRSAIWCPASPGVPDELTDAEPARFFRPQPSAAGVFSTWLGVYLETSGRTAPRVWNEIADIIEDAYRLVAPKTLINELEFPVGKVEPEVPADRQHDHLRRKPKPGEPRPLDSTHRPSLADLTPPSTQQRPVIALRPACG